VQARFLFVFSSIACVAACGSDTSSGFGDSGGDAPLVVDAGGGDGGDSGGPIFPDASSPDAAGCNVLNIGIIGNPGSNPSSNFQTWLTKAGTTTTRIQTTANLPFTANDIAPYQVIVLDQLARDYTPTEAAVVKAFVENGGGLISMTGYNGSVTDWRANAMIGLLGVTYGGSLVSGPVTTFVPHPITNGLTSITFAGGYVVSENGPSTNTRTAIGSISAGNVAYAIQAVKGRAFVWGDEWIEFDSEWTTLPEVKKLWVNIFGWVAPGGCPLNPN
jgi:hypothetical protein